MAYPHRIDDTNVGDLLRAPYLYMDVFPRQAYDIFDSALDIRKERIVAVGGGELGRKFFLSHTNGWRPLIVHTS